MIDAQAPNKPRIGHIALIAQIDGKTIGFSGDLMFG